MNISKGRGRRKAEVNIVPLVDVLTVLIFFFLLTMQFKDIYAVDITPPQMQSSESVSETKPLIIAVAKDGKYFWNSEEVSESKLEEKIKQLATSENEGITLLADKNASVQSMMKVIDFAKLSKIKKPNGKLKTKHLMHK